MFAFHRGYILLSPTNLIFTSVKIPFSPKLVSYGIVNDCRSWYTQFAYYNKSTVAMLHEWALVIIGDWWCFGVLQILIYALLSSCLMISSRRPPWRGKKWSEWMDHRWTTSIHNLSWWLTKNLDDVSCSQETHERPLPFWQFLDQLSNFAAYRRVIDYLFQLTWSPLRLYVMIQCDSKGSSSGHTTVWLGAGHVSRSWDGHRRK